jgi:hypothetical protein
MLLGADERMADVATRGDYLSIDDCIAVDKETVRQVMELEISDPHLLPVSVVVRCVDGAQEIRIRRSSVAQEEVRTAHVAPASDEETSAERQARSRELALSIAEFVRWPGASSVAPVTVPAPPGPPARPVPELAPVSTLATQPTETRRQLGILYAVDRFSRGQTLMGADLFLSSRVGAWYMAELRIGGRLGADQVNPGLRLLTRAGIVSAGAGLNLWSRGHVLGGALVVCAQSYLVQFRGEGASENTFTTRRIGALALAVEPRLMVALTHHLALQASVAAGWVPHGIVVRVQGIEAPSISGFALSANLGGAFAF